MSGQSPKKGPLSAEQAAYYASGEEADRLTVGVGPLEFARTQEIVLRYLPPTPAVILDIGGGGGVYSRWLTGLGYDVHLIDASPVLIDRARRLAEKDPTRSPGNMTVGDARQLDFPDNFADGVLLLGPLYHLTERADRIMALQEAQRVLKSGSVIIAAVISRFASLLDGLSRRIDDPLFDRIVEQDLHNGQHRNPTGKPEYFTTAFFHHPDELPLEMADAGFFCERVLPVEGPGWLVQDFPERWRDPQMRERLLNAVRWTEPEPSLLGLSAHLLGIGYRR